MNTALQTLQLLEDTFEAKVTEVKDWTDRERMLHQIIRGLVVSSREGLTAIEEMYSAQRQVLEARIRVRDEEHLRDLENGPAEMWPW